MLRSDFHWFAYSSQSSWRLLIGHLIGHLIGYHGTICKLISCLHFTQRILSILIQHKKLRSWIWIEMVNYQSLDIWKFYQIPFFVFHNLQHDNFQSILSTKMYFCPSSQIFIIISELWNGNKLRLYWLTTHSNLLSLSAIIFQVCWTVICINP